MTEGIKKNIVYGSSSLMVLAVCGYYIAFGGSVGPRDAGVNGAVAQVRQRELGGDKPVKKTRNLRGRRDKKQIDRRQRTFEDTKRAPTHRRHSHQRQRVQKQRPAPPM